MSIKKIKVKYLILFIISFLTLIITLLTILTNLQENKKTQILENNYNDIPKDTYVDKSKDLINPPANLNDSSYYYESSSFLNVDFAEILEENNETVAWLQVNGTTIDYPVVQTTNNEFYLSHSFDKSTSTAGWIFSDFRNNLTNLNYNTIIYGHRRLNDSMFGSLKNVLTEEWFNNIDNHIIKLSSLNNNTIWQIFSVYSIPYESYYLTTFFSNNFDYLKFLETIKKRSVYNFNTTVNTQDRILTLSSCKDTFGNRIVVHAKLLKKETR